MQLPCQSKTLLKHELFSESLETEGFDFDSVVANKNACLTLFDGLPEISPIQPLELGVFDKNREIRRKRLQTRMLSRKTPAAGILQLLPGIAIASPELCVTQLAMTFDILELVEVIMELTGSYSLPANELDSTAHTVYNTAPVTTRARIEECAWHLPRIYGQRKLEQALKIAMEGAASPVESKLAIFLKPPLRKGGYGLGPLALNPQIVVPEEFRRYMQKDCYYPDIFLPAHCIDIEYESTEFT